MPTGQRRICEKTKTENERSEDVLLDLASYVLEVDEVHPCHLAKLPGDETFRGHDHEPLSSGPEELEGPLEVAVAADEDRHVVVLDGVEHVQDDLDVQVRLPYLSAVVQDDDLQLLGDDRVPDVRKSGQEALLPRIRRVLLPDEGARAPY